MSREYVHAAVAALQADPVIAGWATGGILPRDPRRSGPNQTEDAFETEPSGDIKPTIGVVDGMAVTPPGGIRRSVVDAVEVRLFAPDFHVFYDGMSATAVRIQRLLDGYRHSNELPGRFQFDYRMGPRNGGAFEDVVFDEIRFDVVSVYAPLEV